MGLISDEEDEAGHGDARRTERDLAAVLALPALWRSFEPGQTVSSLVEVLAGLLRADFVYAVVVDRLVSLRHADIYPRNASGAMLRRQLDELVGDGTAGDEETYVDGLRHELSRDGTRVWIVSPRGQAQRWHVVAGSKNHDFPTALERFLMETASEQAAISVEKSILIDAERNARAEAEAANSAKSDFLASMSHELRTPLNAISGYVELMQLGIRGPVSAEQADDLSRIRRSSQHLIRLINDILTFARMEAGHLEIRMTDVGLCDAVASLRDLIHPQLHARELQFECVLPPPDVGVRADPERLRQILLNLLSNAVKFTAAGGFISVTCTATEGNAAVHVRDTGCGIPATKLDRIFEPFVQADQSFARSTDGVGLGLTISRELARAMGGDLTVESGEGFGSTFTLTLPTSVPRWRGPSPA
ncbi:MAG: sensor protein [Gemmatimonadetes bacterium]|nr:sensor protein [Gemmatimonadota bacterium]